MHPKPYQQEWQAWEHQQVIAHKFGVHFVQEVGRTPCNSLASATNLLCFCDLQALQPYEMARAINAEEMSAA